VCYAGQAPLRPKGYAGQAARTGGFARCWPRRPAISRTTTTTTRATACVIGEAGWQVFEVRKGESQNAYEQYVWGIHNGKGLIYASPHYLRIQCSSISSSDRPLVSGTHPHTSTMVTRQKAAYTKNGKP